METWALLLTLFCYLLARGVYNAYFHPLAKVPGPKFATVSRLWLFWKELQGCGHDTIFQWHKSHGPVIRIAPNEVSIKDQDTFLTIYKQGTSYLKEPKWYRAFEGVVSNIFTTVDKEAHLQHKRLMIHAFSRAATFDHEKLMYSKVITWMEQVTRHVRRGRPVPLFPAFRQLTLETITTFCYGDIFPVEKEFHVDWQLFKVFDDSPKAIIFMQQFPTMRSVLNAINKVIPLGAINSFAEFQQLAADKLKVFHETEKNGFSLFDNMIKTAESKGQRLSDERLVAESLTLLFAGTDTTSSTLAFGLYHLLQRPDLYFRLQKEMFDLIPNLDSKPSVVDLEKSVLLDACLKEGLRITCAIRGRLPRVVPTEGAEVCGVRLRPGTIISTAPLFQCYDEDVFPDPDTYRPERWLGSDVARLNGFNQPFSRGTRQCIGQSFSLAEQRIAISQFVRRFSPTEGFRFKKLELKEYGTLVIGDDMEVPLGINDQDP